MSYPYALWQERLLQESSSQELFPNSLKRMQQLSQSLGFPHQNFSSVHIAGSNGKGSVATKIAVCLQKAGYRTALYTSPHLFCVRERALCNGQKMSEDDFCRILERIYAHIDKARVVPTFFEIVTLLAFIWFVEQKVDVAIIETGLGGQRDATNIITPLLSVITSLSIEHSDRLGSTIEEIADEKAGIIKQNIPVVVGPRADYTPIRQKASLLNSPLILVPYTPGWYDVENVAIAEASLSLLESFFPSLQNVSMETLLVRPACRLEEKKGVVFDVAHNPDGLKRLYEGIKTLYPTRKVRTVIGISKEKDLISCLQEVAKHSTFTHLVTTNQGRLSSVEQLAKEFAQFSHAFSCETSLRQGILQAKRCADDCGELLVVTGSFYLMLAAQKELRIYEPSVEDLLS